MKPGSERCEVCDVVIAPKGRRRHEQTIGHQDAEPRFHAARAADAQARKDGLERLIDLDFAPFDPNLGTEACAGHSQVTPVLDALGIPVVALSTGFHRGTRYSHNYDELWTESWAANIVNWKGVNVGIRLRALEHAAADPSLREHLRVWPSVIGSTVSNVGLNLSTSTRVWVRVPNMAYLMVLANPLDRWTDVKTWEIDFDDYGQIVDLRSSHWRQDQEMPMPPLHVMIEVQGAINELARCSSVIRWLAGAP